MPLRPFSDRLLSARPPCRGRRLLHGPARTLRLPWLVPAALLAVAPIGVGRAAADQPDTTSIESLVGPPSSRFT